MRDFSSPSTGIPGPGSHQVLWPALPGDFVERPRLIDQINRGLDRPLTLVSAPAGFGKSILVSSWLKTCPRPERLVGVQDESADDLGVFLHYFLTAIQTISSAALPRTRALLAGFSLPPPDVLAGSLINDLDEIDTTRRARAGGLSRSTRRESTTC